MSDKSADIAERIAEVAGRGGLTIAVAESLTSGAIASVLGAASDASTWFTGGVVAYASAVKFELLSVEKGPVVTASAAEQMAAGVRDLLHSDIAVAVTGAGGPEPQDGQPGGTVFLAVASADGVHVEKRSFDGSPSEVVHATVAEALTLLLKRMRGPA
ncbi:nicotinamide-nucleotide amidase [Paramicrobacterium humi]|uniref:Nicotinamide-nucleotide amidase n=1 Tax=Paramicrobacterium humi TaxID=640635 RepID=A0A1H4JF37_9MICO|nr:CinA family protein [Microbacterium humi]SEB44695.1 nicotinamide-nucleotide amidase [Microbacterium humi]